MSLICSHPVPTAVRMLGANETSATLIGRGGAASRRMRRAISSAWSKRPSLRRRSHSSGSSSSSSSSSRTSSVSSGAGVADGQGRYHGDDVSMALSQLRSKAEHTHGEETDLDFDLSDARTIVLNDECMVEMIFSSLDTPSLAKAARVCRRWAYARWECLNLRNCRHIPWKALQQVLAVHRPKMILMSRARVEEGLLAEVLIAAKSAQALELRGCGLSSRSVEHLALGFLALHNRVLRLDLSGNKLRGDAATALAEGLRQNTSLLELNLSSCRLTPASTAVLLEALVDHPRINKLKVCHNGLCSPMVARALSSLLTENESLAHLDMSGMYFEHGMDISNVSDAIAANTTLETLVLSEMGLLRTFLAALADGLKRNTGIKYLFLESNGLTSEAGGVICDILKSNTTLLSLSLRDNFLQYVGAVCVAQALQNNTTLLHLDLATNQISHQALHTITEAFRFKPPRGLISLDLSFNHFGSMGAVCLSRWLSKSEHRMCALKVVDCFVKGDGLATLLSTLRTSRSLAILDISHNTFDPAAATELVEFIKHNRSVTHLCTHANAMAQPEPHKCLSSQAIFESLGDNRVLRLLTLAEHMLDGDHAALAAHPACTIRHAA
ncbi:hypothetical protein PTSG_04206 [Salpingoeca rosetta]|uniref:F-box domain-containing protein n=1 Tax=Salpingoeca rosetta (strain ATCC 50818 / BSB-021) TaxID=946362 RepID=F2U6W6_SALR5|nr:uncharacterized protein PTSG_04206 [Salpingoeca rosetta]EGD83598.1 hypothetical protein PTSG_04206 [Salpingoeca rosetta]|eukprot:XP_004995102.1 hypothetical protein PTSG_04206 [Salpingoeca rosetta]